MHARPRSAMDRAPEFEAAGSEFESPLYNDFNMSLSLNLMQFLHKRKGMKSFILVSVILIFVALAACMPAGTVPIKPISTAGVDIVEHNAQGAIPDPEKAIALGLTADQKQSAET